MSKPQSFEEAILKVAAEEGHDTEEIAKHLPGKHDQKSHGNWAHFRAGRPLVPTKGKSRAGQGKSKKPAASAAGGGAAGGGAAGGGAAGGSAAAAKPKGTKAPVKTSGPNAGQQVQPKAPAAPAAPTMTATDAKRQAKQLTAAAGKAANAGKLSLADAQKTVQDLVHLSTQAAAHVKHLESIEQAGSLPGATAQAQAAAKKAKTQLSLARMAETEVNRELLMARIIERNVALKSPAAAGPATTTNQPILPTLKHPVKDAVVTTPLTTTQAKNDAKATYITQHKAVDLWHQLDDQARASGKGHLPGFKLDGEDKGLKAIAKSQGKDGKPQVVTKAEMDTYLRQSGAQELYRTFGNDQQHKVDFRDKDEWWTGQGIYGNGTYSAFGAGNSQGKNVGLYQAKAYGDWRNNLVRMALRPEAKVIKYDTLENLRATERQKLNNLLNQPGLSRADKKRLKISLDFAGDAGRFAALLGYDAIHIDHHGTGGRGDYMNILNRSAVVIEDTP